MGSQGGGQFIAVPCHLEEMSKDGKGNNSVNYLARWRQLLLFCKNISAAVKIIALKLYSRPYIFLRSHLLAAFCVIRYNTRQPSARALSLSLTLSLSLSHANISFRTFLWPLELLEQSYRNSINTACLDRWHGNDESTRNACGGMIKNALERN